MIFLNINNLNVSIEGKKILNDFNININEGEVHAIMAQMVVVKVLWLMFLRAMKTTK